MAAQSLQNEAGIPARTIASWLHRIRDGEGLAGVDVLVVDEAAMTDDRAMAVLLTEAARTRTKVVTIGGPLHLQAVGPSTPPSPAPAPPTTSGSRPPPSNTPRPAPASASRPMKKSRRRAGVRRARAGGRRR